MDTHKISPQRLKIFLSIFWVIILIIAFFSFTHEIPLGQIIKTSFLKKQALPLLLMGQGENRAASTKPGFFDERLIGPGQDNFIFSGPYWTLLPGDYTVQWEIISDCAGSIGWIDVVSRLATTEYGKMEVVINEAHQSQIVELPFKADFSRSCEARFYAKNQCEFKVIKAELLRERINWAAFGQQLITKIKSTF